MASFKESKAFHLADTSGKHHISEDFYQTPNKCYHDFSRVWKGAIASVFCDLVGTAFMHHNMNKLSRIYPAGSRTDSSNYNPVPMWNVGCQIGTPPSSLYAEIQPITITKCGVTVSLLVLFDLVFSCIELPDPLQRDVPKPGKVSAKWFLWLHPEAWIPERPVFSVWSQQTRQRALAKEEDLSSHSERYSWLNLKDRCLLELKVPCRILLKIIFLQSPLLIVMQIAFSEYY